MSAWRDRYSSRDTHVDLDMDVDPQDGSWDLKNGFHLENWKESDVDFTKRIIQEFMQK